jgi:FolB domain-containing protein
MDTITLCDLEVQYRVGVSDEERARPQRLLLTLELRRDFSAAATADDLRATIDYDALAQWLKGFGDGRQWKLIERLAVDIAEAVLRTFKPDAVSVEVKKFVLPQARFVSVRLTRTRTQAER